MTFLYDGTAGLITYIYYVAHYTPGTYNWKFVFNHLHSIPLPPAFTTHLISFSMSMFVWSIIDLWWWLLTKSCPTLCNPMDCSLPGSSVHEISQARILEWVVISFSRGSSWPRDQTWVSCIAGRFFMDWLTGKYLIDLCHYVSYWCTTFLQSKYQYVIRYFCGFQNAHHDESC